MVYDNGWQKAAELTLFGRTVKMSIMAAAYTGEQITEGSDSEAD